MTVRLVCTQLCALANCDGIKEFMMVMAKKGEVAGYARLFDELLAVLRTAAADDATISEEDIYQSATKYEIKLLKKLQQQQYVEKMAKRIATLRSKSMPIQKKKDDNEQIYWQQLNSLRIKYMPCLDYCHTELSRLEAQLKSQHLQFCLSDDPQEVARQQCEQKRQTVGRRLADLVRVIDMLTREPGSSVGKVDMFDLKRILVYIQKKAKPMAKQLQQWHQQERNMSSPHAPSTIPSTAQCAAAHKKTGQTTGIVGPVGHPLTVQQTQSPEQRATATPDDLLELVQDSNTELKNADKLAVFSEFAFGFEAGKPSPESVMI